MPINFIGHPLPAIAAERVGNRNRAAHGHRPGKTLAFVGRQEACRDQSVTAAALNKTVGCQT